MPRSHDLDRSKADKTSDADAIAGYFAFQRTDLSVPWPRDDQLQRVVAGLHAQVLARVGDADDRVTAGRRQILEHHSPGDVTGCWVECPGSHGREGGEQDWPCFDYRAAAADAADLLPPER